MPISLENTAFLSAFAPIAREYCLLIDSLPQADVADFYKKLEVLLPRLLSAILPVEAEMARRKHREFDKLSMTLEQRQALSCAISGATAKERGAAIALHDSRKSGVHADYIDEYCSTRAFMLWNDLADIYCDLHHGLALWELHTPDSEAEASWEWRFGFEIHWGEHVFRAMTTIHEIRYRLTD